MTVSLLEAKANLEELLLKAAAGESVVIALEHKQFDVTLCMEGGNSGRTGEFRIL